MRESAPPDRAFTRVDALLGGGRHAAALEFEFLSLIMVGVQSMET